MSKIHVYDNVEELILALDSAEEKAAISDDALRSALAKIFYKPRSSEIIEDPFSADYRHRQFELYEKITVSTPRNLNKHHLILIMKYGSHTHMEQEVIILLAMH
ncbi:MAG: hypothetical protein KDJ22_06225 [Candidatus Competibacteraceae bacterium]|nr:hypothetical protein [Candidatus Competibacteraceae bacterium]MCP5127346.1 hypothetical protein [Gammaproteobacteria bacterium]HRX69862.1 hypothetical protein [Candidatus Competibacteraceae bacterium]